MSNDDRITRAGLQAFANKCKETFDIQPTYETVTGAYSNINGTLSISEGCNIILDLNFYGSNGYGDSYVYLSINEAANSIVYNKGPLQITAVDYITNNNQLRLNLGLSNTASKLEIKGSMQASSGKWYTINVSQLGLNGRDTIDSALSLSSNQFINTADLSTTQTDFKIRSGKNIYGAFDDVSYSSGKIFDQIQKAQQLSHKISFVVDDTQSDYSTDLSGDTIYVKGIQTTNNTIGTYYKVTVKDGLVIGGDSSLPTASSSTLGLIKLGYSSLDNKQFALQTDANGAAYVELPTALFKYQGIIEGDLETLQNKIKSNEASEGYIYTLKPTDSNIADYGAEYVCVNKNGTLTWEYLGEKFVQQDVYWAEPEGEENWSGKLLKNAPTLSITKPTTDSNGSIQLGAETIGIKNATTITAGTDDILASQAYVDQRTPTIQLNGTDVSASNGKLNIQAITSVTITDGNVTTSDGAVTLPKYPDVPIKSIYIGTTQQSPDDGKVTLPQTQQFGTNNNGTLTINDFVPSTAPTYNYEKTILITNSGESDMTVNFPQSSDNVTVIKMISDLTIPASKHGEVVGTYYHENKILTINGGVEV